MTSETQNHSVCMAVLPFENLSGNSEYDYFSSGFVEDLITDLSQFRNLQVISSYTSRKIGSKARDALASAKEFSIDYLLKGNLRRKGKQIRSNTQLLETKTGRVVWAERYDSPLASIFDIQDDIVERVSGAISAQIDRALLASARKKPLTSLAAYDCWLRGMEQLREGTQEADREARLTFEQAVAIDPHYSRAYAGLSLSYFNDWSCQLWEHWEETEQNAYRFAMKAFELDDSDHITRLILGRILLYRRQFDMAQEHVDQSLALNANDADNLVQIAICKTFLGYPEQGEELFLKALRLNPYRNLWYYTGGAFTYFSQKKYQACIETALKGPLTEVWVDLPAFIAAANAHMGNQDEATRYLEIFLKVFREKIITDSEPGPEDIIAWEKMANPFKLEEDMANLIDGLVLAGLEYHTTPVHIAKKQKAPAATIRASSTFRNHNGLWHMAYEGQSIQIQEVKGFHDLARLLAVPGVEVHCLEMMGSPGSMGEDTPAIDKKALGAYEKRIRYLREEISQAQAMNDLGRSTSLTDELDQLTDHISKSLGLGRRSRQLDAGAERARAAVTWRIRSAIKKIGVAHPTLGHHLANTIRTGTFCSYDPEKVQAWKF